MALKTDYKDAMFDGSRKYRITENDDGTVTIEDVTSYTQTGDKFGANDVNGTNEEVNRVAGELETAKGKIENKAESNHTHSADKVGAFGSDTLHGPALIADANNLTNGAWKLGADALNLPVAGKPSMIYHKDWDVNFASQIALTFDACVVFRFKRGGTWEPWQTHFLPKYGGEVDGPLHVINGNVFRVMYQGYNTEIHQYNACAYLRSTDGTTYTDLLVGVGVEPAYQRKVGDVLEMYKLYGTHNITGGTWDLWSGNSALTNNFIYQQYE